ncbi:MAG: hypothetical protein ABEJ75_01550 [Candidatus Nanohaloarchaea archaeon]
MIVGFNVDNLEASKKQEAAGNIQINYLPELEDVEEVEVDAFEEKVAKIDYEFTVQYEADDSVIAEIQMSGNVLWKGQLEEILETWEEENDLPDQVSAPLMNELYRKLISEAVGVADTLNLLPPVPTPQVQ